MILQPLIENSIKHGIEKKVGGGRIIIRSRREHDHGIIEIVDNGAGMSDTNVNHMRGIGLRNVDERLRVIYGENYHLRLESTPGKGTCARITIPELIIEQQATT